MCDRCVRFLLTLALCVGCCTAVVSANQVSGQTSPTPLTQLPSGQQRLPRIVNGDPVNSGQYPFLTAVMSGRYASVYVAGNSIGAYYFGAGVQSVFDGNLVDCGLALAPCAGVEGQVCAIILDFPQESSTVLTPGEQLNHCRAGGGVGAIFRANVQNYADRLDVGDVDANIPAVYLVGNLAHQRFTSALTRGNLPVAVADQIPEWIVCGGSYLGGPWVLTAAHCVIENNRYGSRLLEPQEVLVNVAAHDLVVDKHYTQQVVEIIVGDYRENRPWGENDYALLRIDSAPVRGRPISLVSRNALDQLAANSAPALVLGWGSTVAREPLVPSGLAVRTSKTPQAALLQLHTVSSCDTLWQNFLNNHGIDGSGLNIRDIHICASDALAQGDTCQGDSGGPLVVNSGGELQLAGVTNFGLGCGSENSVPGVYASVPAFSDWVYAETGLPDFDKEIQLPPEQQNENVTPQGFVAEDSIVESGAGCVGEIFLVLLIIPLLCSRMERRTHLQMFQCSVL